MLFAVSGGVQVLLPQDWMENDTLMRLDWLAGAVRSKGKGVLNITGFNQLNWVRKYGTGRWRIAQFCRPLQ